jgi:PBP1b-binding outer membrane lipoprotein LpoB
MVVAVGLLLGGCAAEPAPTETPEPTGARTFHLDFEARNGIPALPVDVVDRTGLVVSVARAAPAPVVSQ